MKLIVGLGNPGIAYRRTRHNLGFMAVQELAGQRRIRFRRGRFQASEAAGQIGKEEILLIRPMTFMNRSGVSVAGYVRSLGCDLGDLLVICDDVHLDLGRIRLRRSGSDGGHNGLRSVVERLGSQSFARLRLGVGRPPEGMEMMDYVLGVFGRSDWPVVHETTARAAQAVETWVYHGIDEAMNRFNQ